MFLTSPLPPTTHAPLKKRHSYIEQRKGTFQMAFHELCPDSSQCSGSMYILARVVSKHTHMHKHSTTRIKIRNGAYVDLITSSHNSLHLVIPTEIWNPSCNRHCWRNWLLHDHNLPLIGDCMPVLFQKHSPISKLDFISYRKRMWSIL